MSDSKPPTAAPAESPMSVQGETSTTPRAEAPLPGHGESAMAPHAEPRLPAQGQPPPTANGQPPTDVLAAPMGAPAMGPLPVAPPSAPSALNLVVGPALWICGALLWSYVVLGELVIEAKFPEALAWLLMAGAYAGTWLRSVRPGRLFHRVGPGILGLVWFVFVLLFVTSLLGTHRRSTAAAVAVGVLLLGVAAFYSGRAFTSPPKVELHTAQRTFLIIGWVIIWGTTGLVLVSLVD